MGMTREERSENATLRKARIHTYITQDPPVPFAHIMAMEGITERPLRQILKELEAEHGVEYVNTQACKAGDTLPFGITESSHSLRANLANELYRVTNSHNTFGFKGREDAAQAVGLNPREQIRAENKPFTHDWKLSQIERLARTLNQDPWEFVMRCLTT